MSITEDQIIWYPGVYNGREGDYAKHISELVDDEIVSLVQLRAMEDGEWAINNGLVGDNENKMRKMMAWVSNPVNIRQCIDAHLVENPTIDWICRDLANATKAIFAND